MKTLFNNLLNRINKKEDEHDIKSGRAVMITVKRKGTRREKTEKYYPLPLWKKCTTCLMLILTFQFIVPPHVIAQEIAEAQQRAIIEQNQRNYRTKAPAHLQIAQQTEATVQLLLKTCRQIENNVIAGKSIDSEMKDIEAFRKNFEEIKERSLKQMDAQRAKWAERKDGKEILARIDTAQKAIREKFETLSTHLKNVVDNRKKPEALKTAVRALAKYLEDSTPKNVNPKSSAPKKKVTFSRQGLPGRYPVTLLSSVPHNGILLASANDTIGDWLNGLDNLAITGAATAADLAATPEIVLDDEIRLLAESLEKHPVKIFEYVRNNFAYEPYWGSQKGSKRTLLEKAGNDVDLASLTMALLRASGINCRYVCGTIEMPIADAGRWIGVDDPTQIAKTFISNGIPCETSVSAGQISKIRLNHTWVVAYVDYFPYHGTRNETPNTWIEIDPSFKQNTFTTKTDLQTTIGINPDTLLTNVKAQSELGADNLYAAKVPEAFILSEIFSYQEPIRSYLAANSLTTENVFRQRKVNEEKYGLFTVTDNYNIVSRGLSFNALPSSLSSSVTFTLKNEDGSQAFAHTVSLSAIANARITLGYKPATDGDQQNIAANADAEAFPVYMVNLIPEMKIDDTVIGNGAAIGMGHKQYLEVSFKIPGFEPTVAQSQVTAGSFSVLVPDYQNVTAAEISRQQATLAALAANPSSSRDVVLGEALRGLGLSYWHQLDRFNQVTAGNLGVAITRVPSMLRVSWDLKVADQFGLPFTASVDRLKLNIIYDYNIPVAINQEKIAGEKQFPFTSALTGTALEHNVLAQPFSGEAASAARVIQQANNLNKKVYTVTANNINEIIPLLDLPAAMINDIRNAVNANIEVTVPECAVPLNGTEYFAYVKRDIATSASEFYLDSRGGEMKNVTLKATDLLLDGSASSYNTVAKSMADWLNVAVDSTTQAGLAYLPAITALNSWYAKRTELDPVTTIAAIIAVSGPITKVYNQPAILNVVTGDKLISPNGDGIKDSFTLSAVVTRNAAWKFQILNAQNQPVITEESTTPNININFGQNVPDGTYSYRITASANGVNADPISGTFKVDCTKPTVAITSPDPATTVTDNKSLALRGTADDINFEKVTITAQGVGMTEPVQIYESSNITVENLLTTISSALYTNGALLITMTATDKAGNSNTVSKTYTLNNPVPDLQAPTVQMVAKNGNDVVTAGSTVDAESGALDVAISATDNIGVAKINLLLDGAVAATVSKLSELNHVLNTMVLRDGTHTLQAEAYDAAGNKGQSALLNFSLTSPISNFRVTPDLAKPGTSNISITANIREALADGQKWVLSFEGPSQIPNIEGTTAAIAGNINPANYQDGKYTVTLTVNGKTPSLPFEIDMVKMAPVAKIANIADGDIIREGLFNLVGTADDADPSDTVSYKIEVLDNEGTVVSNVTPKPWSGSNMKEGRVNNASLGELDFTMLRNNVYTLQLTVSDGEQSSVDSVKFALNSELKIGHMSFSQQDLVVPVNGQPISVIRSYNSLNTNVKGEFGLGWTYSIRDIEFETNETRANIRDFDGEVFSLRTGGDRDVTITMPDGKRLSFMFKLTQSSQATQPWAVGSWVPAPGVHATLEATCSTKYITLPGGMQFWEAGVYGTPMEYFDFPGFILTMMDGTKYEIVREDLGYHMLEEYVATPPQVNAYKGGRLKSITDPNGNRTVFEDNEIIAYNASGERTKSIYFDKNGDGLITAIYAPSSLNADGTKPEDAVPQFKYEYDSLKNLVKVHKLIDRTKPVDQQYAVTEYIYGEPSRPHYITAIKDALGNQPMKCIYDENGRLIATEDANGNRIAMQHDLSGRTETITDRMGNPTVHTYDDMGNVTATIDAQGNATKYTYDSLGNKLSETNALGYTTSYTYDSMGNQTSITDPLGNVTRYEYDGKGNQTKIIDAMGNVTTNAYDSAGNLLSTTDALGNTTNRSYDSNGNLTSMTDASGKVTVSFGYSGANPTSMSDKTGVIRNFGYDSMGNMTGTSYVWTDNGISKNVSSQTVYDDAGQEIQKIDAEGNVSRTEYNVNGQVIKTTNILGNSTENVYNASGNVIETRNADGTFSRTVYDANGRGYITQNTHIEGSPTTGSRSVYDSAGRIIRTELLENMVVSISDGSSIFVSGDVVSSTSTVYDAAGQAIKKIDANGNVTQYEFDACGRNIATIDALGNRTEFTYDASGRQLSMKNANGNTVSYEYDALGRKTKTTFPDGTYSTAKYDNLGQKIEETDAAGLVTKFEYNDAGQLSAVIKPEVNGVTPRWEYSYNQYGQRTSIKDPKGNVTNLTYDYAGRQLSRTLPMGQKETAEYNNYGQLIKQTDFKGQTVETIYDSFGRQATKKYYISDSTTAAEETLFTYDGLGRIQSILQKWLEFTADGNSSVTQRETSYTYNSRGEITQIFTPEGSVNYEYDAKTGAKTRVSTDNSDIRYSYDALNRLKTVAVHMRNGVALSTPEVTTYDYTKVGSRASVSLPNGITTSYQYDNLNRLTNVSHKKADAIIASYTYDLLPTGRRSAITEVTPEGTSQVQYTYDNLYRLTNEQRTGVKSLTASYTYDINSNRTRKVETISGITEIINYEYNANDQLLSEVSSANGTTIYTYDVNGSLTTKINEGKFSYQYGYDLRNRLVTANITRKEGTTDVAITSSYAYNTDGIRTRTLQTINGITQSRYFLLDDGHTGYAQIFEETSALGGNIARCYTIGDDVLSQTVGGVTSHLLYDGHGSTRQLTDSNGAVTANYAYDSYGKMLGGNPGVTDGKTSATDLLYAGEQFDPGLQMEYLRARYYDQDNGRFNRLDPFEGNSEDPQSLHKYAYAHCDPVNGIDPSGESFVAILATMALIGMFSGLAYGFFTLSIKPAYLNTSEYLIACMGIGMLGGMVAPIIAPLLKIGLMGLGVALCLAWGLFFGINSLSFYINNARSPGKEEIKVIALLSVLPAIFTAIGGAWANSVENNPNLTMGQIFNTKVTAFVIPDVILKIQDIVWGWIFFKAVNQKETKEDIRAEINRQIRVYYS